MSEPKRKTILKPEFLGFWLALVEDCGGKIAPAHRMLLERWKLGCGIPGYPPVSRPGITRAAIPYGWSYQNLRRFVPDRLSAPSVAAHSVPSV